MDKPNGSKLITYCDKCADAHDYPSKDEKVKSQCKLCGFTGPVNEVENQIIVSYDNFNDSTWKGGGYKVCQLDPFPLGQLRETIHPQMTHKLLTEKIAIFYDKNIVVIANPQTGQQIEITF
jgi:hypothetical protein